jgi:hypothetical protein
VKHYGPLVYRELNCIGIYMVSQKPQAIGNLLYLVNEEDFEEEKVTANHLFPVSHVIFYM